MRNPRRVEYVSDFLEVDIDLPARKVDLDRNDSAVGESHRYPSPLGVGVETRAAHRTPTFGPTGFGGLDGSGGGIGAPGWLAE